jgi:nucleoside-diphosphate-sugar epimerase
MKVLVTGGSGYFGTRFSSLFNNSSFFVDSYDIGYFWDCWLSEKIDTPEFKISAQEVTGILISKYDAVVHLAGISNDPLKQISDSVLHTPSLEYSRVIAEECKRQSKKLIYASSCSVYGKQSEVVTELSKVNPQTPYSQNKIDVENLLLALKDSNWTPIILRFSTLYGPSPRMRFDTVINMLCGMSLVENEIILNSNGEAKRPFIHIDDACQILKLLLEMPTTEYMRNVDDAILNVGANNLNFAIIDIAEFISELTHKPVNILNNDKKVSELILDRKHQDGVDSRSYVVNFDRLHKLLGKNMPSRDIKVGIKDTLSHFTQIKLNKNLFYDKRYYRLQFLEDCVEAGILNSKLQFVQ